jgi:hypothetical protein
MHANQMTIAIEDWKRVFSYESSLNILIDNASHQHFGNNGLMGFTEGPDDPNGIRTCVRKFIEKQLDHEANYSQVTMKALLKYFTASNHYSKWKAHEHGLCAALMSSSKELPKKDRHSYSSLEFTHRGSDHSISLGSISRRGLDPSSISPVLEDILSRSSSWVTFFLNACTKLPLGFILADARTGECDIAHIPLLFSNEYFDRLTSRIVPLQLADAHSLQSVFDTNSSKSQLNEMKNAVRYNRNYRGVMEWKSNRYALHDESVSSLKVCVCLKTVRDQQLKPAFVIVMIERLEQDSNPKNILKLNPSLFDHIPHRVVLS